MITNFNQQFLASMKLMPSDIIDKDSSVFLPCFYTKPLSNLIRQPRAYKNLFRMFLVNGQGVINDFSVAVQPWRTGLIVLELCKQHFNPQVANLIIENSRDEILWHTSSAAHLLSSTTFLLRVRLQSHQG